MLNINKLLKTIRNNKLILIVFLLSTLFFIYQRLGGGVHWDFALYVSNARYIFSDGFYFEWWVPPLTPVLLGIFSIFNCAMAEYIYIIFVSCLFLLSCLKFCQVFRINKVFFYSAFMNAYVLNYGIRNGTELLSLSFVMLFFSYLFTKDNGKKSSFFLSLSFLARYSNIFVLPFALLNRNLKKILISVLIFFMVMTPWLLFNYFKTGNPLSSIADYYVFVSLQRAYYSDQFLQDVGLAIAAVFLFSLVAFRKKLKKIMNMKDFSMLLFLVLMTVAFLNMPFRHIRYLFFATLPIIYFLTRHVQDCRKALYFLLVFNLITAILIAPQYLYNEDAQFRIIDLKGNCTLMSNAWVYFNYHGIPSEPYPFKELINESINNGYRIVLFKWIEEPEYSRDKEFLSEFPIIADKSNYLVLGDESLCKDYYKINIFFKERKNDFLMAVHNMTISEEMGCSKNQISASICHILGVYT